LGGRLKAGWASPEGHKTPAATQRSFVFGMRASVRPVLSRLQAGKWGMFRKPMDRRAPALAIF